MKITAEQRAFLGISEVQRIILGAMEQDPSQSVTALAKKTGIPRTTVGFLLHSLRGRRLAAKVKVMNHFEWRLEERQRLAGRLRGLLDAVSGEMRGSGSIRGKSLDIDYAEGEAAFMERVRAVFRSGRSQRIKMIQSPFSIRSQGRKLENARFREFVFDLHRSSKWSRIISEVVAPWSALDAFALLGRRELESHFGRPLIAYLAPDDRFPFDADVMIRQDQVIILDHAIPAVLSFKSTAIAKIFQSYFELMKAISRKFDLNAHLRTLIDKQ